MNEPTRADLVRDEARAELLLELVLQQAWRAERRL
jgi:hypothetical protein